jgi:hypothetical protein
MSIRQNERCKTKETPIFDQRESRAATASG